MHVAYVCADLGVPVDGTKGASIHVRSLAQALALRGHRVSLLAAHPGARPVVGFRPEVIATGYDRTLKRLKRRLAENRPHSALPREVYALLLGQVARRELERLHARRPIDAIYERHSLWSWAALAFSREHRLTHVLELNAPLVREQTAYRELALTRVAEACERELVGGVDAVVVPSAALARHAGRLGAAGDAIHVLPNAIDPSLFAAVGPPPDGSEALVGKFVVAFVGSLKPWHGVDLLLGAFRRLLVRVPEAHLLVLGDGPLGEQVRTAAAALGPGRVTAPGAVPHSEVPAWLARATVGVAPYPPSRDFYFSPLKIVEYQAAGLAVVASDLGHIASQVEHRKTGILVPPGDEVALAEALADLAHRPRFAADLAAAARRRVLGEHTWDRVASSIEGLLERRRSPAAGRRAQGMDA